MERDAKLRKREKRNEDSSYYPQYMLSSTATPSTGAKGYLQLSFWSV